MAPTQTSHHEPVPYVRVAAPVLVGLMVIMGLVIWLAPVDRTLGEGIKIVYVHVALTWTGMLQLVIAGILGLILLISENPGVQNWLTTLSRVGLGFFAAATLISLWAEIINWGGILWQEPRTSAMLRVLAAAIIAQVLHTWFRRPRIQGGLHLLVALYLTTSLLLAPRFFHPGNPIGASPSAAIQLAFYSLFALCFIAGLWIIGYFHHGYDASSP
ncbi:MAG: hypothetical protein KC418_14830 [Anaerolineales bacterium]|nr:hypothetical protein [Anaerolineales bacterium]MCB8952916.1 hypothetical protein [Ardenticatenales bacterium]